MLCCSVIFCSILVLWFHGCTSHSIFVFRDVFVVSAVYCCFPRCMVVFRVLFLFDLVLLCGAVCVVLVNQSIKESM